MRPKKTQKSKLALDAQLLERAAMWDRHTADMQQNGQSKEPQHSERWSEQREEIRAKDAEISQTKKVMQKEKGQKNKLPKIFLDLLAQGKIRRWQRFPDYFFVDGAPFGRIVYRNGKLNYKYSNKNKKSKEYKHFKNIVAQIQAKLGRPNGASQNRSYCEQ